MKTSVGDMAMNRSIALLFLSSLIGVATVGCDFDDVCGKGLVEDEMGFCRVPPTPEAGASDGGADEGGEAGAPAASSFGKTCASMAECGGDAPICAAPQLPYCTQISCEAGEANAGACPAGWQCIKSGSQPSACVKM